MPVPTLDQTLVDEIIKEVEDRYRFNLIENLLPRPAKLEKRVAVFDAVQEINSYPPQTAHTLEQIMDPNGDPRWIRLIYIGTAKNIVAMLVSDWTSNGLDASIGDLSLESKLDEYRTLQESLNTEFDDRLEKLKETSQRFVRGISGASYSNPLTNPSSPLYRASMRIR